MVEDRGASILFLCNELPVAEFVKVKNDGRTRCKLAVVLGTRTYRSKMTHACISTYSPGQNYYAHRRRSFLN